MEVLLQQLVNGLAVGAVYALVALGYTMVYGVLRLINFAHGELVTLGAYLGFTFLTSTALVGRVGPFAGLALLALVALLRAGPGEAGAWRQHAFTIGGLGIVHFGDAAAFRRLEEAGLHGAAHPPVPWRGRPSPPWRN